MDKEYLRQIANDIKRKLPDNHGFILLTFPFGESDSNRLAYVSDAKREDAINILKEWLIRASGEEEWMKHIK